MFKVVIDGADYEVDFMYNNQGKTVCLVKNYEAVSMGLAEKSDEDYLNLKSVGQKYALTRAVANFKPEVREAIWKEYIRRYKSLIHSDANKKKKSGNTSVFLTEKELIVGAKSGTIQAWWAKL